MTLKRAMSLVLTLCITLGMIAPAMPTARAAESPNIVPGYTDPWDLTKLLELIAPQDTNTESPKFTHEEWTGITVGQVKNAEVYAVNREKACSFATSQVVYDTVHHAVTGAQDFNKEASRYMQYLTGESQNDWSLVVVKNATAVSKDEYKDFYKTEFIPNTSDWKTNLTLPASWTSYGFDYPIYTNTQAPWQEDNTSSNTVPLAPVNYNPVGLYRKTFTVNEGIKSAGGRVYLNFQGAEAAYYVYVNGKEVGYSEDTYSPHSFDVTDYLVDGQNLLAVELHKFCDGTWFELQDMYKDGGIFRDVYLYSAPLVHIDDYRVITDLDANYKNATLKLDVRVRNSSNEPASGYKVDARLYDQGGNIFVNGVTMDIPTMSAATAKSTVSPIVDHVSASATATKLVLNPKLWSAETPNLYTLVLSLYSAEGVYMGSMSQQLGFRKIDFKSSKVDKDGKTTTKDTEYTPITINGKPLLFKGTNRHDSDPIYGKYVSHSVMEKDITLMKQNNINAIRTSHYSNDDYLYYLCDKYGVYMMAETNLESHQLMNNGDKQKLFKKLAMDRTVNAFQRLKNITAIVCWSTGNENYYSSDANYADGMFSDLIKYFKANDSSRPIHSESSNKANGTDMGSNMYPGVSSVGDRAKEKMPYVICEYVHSMGNATGNLREYWDAIRSSDNMLGAFVWDWVDQACKRPLSKLDANYSMTSADNTPAVVTVKGGVNDAPLDDALVAKSIENGYVVFEDTGKFNDALSGTDKQVTIEVIAKPVSDSGSQILFAKGDKQIAIKGDGQDIQFFFSDGKSNWYTVSAHQPSGWLNNWHQVVGVYDKGLMTIYVDGVSLASAQKPNTLIATSEKPALGYQTDKKDRFKGEISLGRIYTAALTKEQIDAQRRTNPAINSTDPQVLLWADFTQMEPRTSDYYDYYAEPFAYQGLYNNAGHFYTFGGDNGETNHSGNFSSNGLVTADRAPRPALLEVKYQYQNFWFTADDIQLLGGQVEVYNESSFNNLSDFNLVWTLKEDENTLGSGVVANATAAPREVRTVKGQPHVTVPLSIPYLSAMPETLKAGAEYYLNLSVRLKEDTLWAKAGYEVAYKQFRLPANVAGVAHTPSSRGVEIDETGVDFITVSGQDFSFKLNKATGGIEDYIYNGTLLLKKGPVPNYWRAPVNNDNGNFTWGWQNLAKGVKPADINGIVVSPEGEGPKTITVDLFFPNNQLMQQTIVYTIESTGAVTLSTTLDAQALKKDKDYERFLRVGTTLVLPEGFEDVSWYGNGPVESMWDRKTFAIVDKYENTVSKLYHPYHNGGDTGTMTDTKWVTVTKPGETAAMAIAAEIPIEFAALHFTADDLTQAKHPYELHPQAETYLSINMRSQGTGNRSCGPDTLSQYCIWNDNAYSYSYTMIPYETEGTNVTDLTRAYRGVASSVDRVLEEAVGELKASISALSVTKASQITKLNTLLARYELLPSDAKAQLMDVYQKLQDDIARAQALAANPYAKVIVSDQGKNKFDVNLTAQENASLSYDEAQQGSVLSGNFIIDTKEKTKYFNSVIGGSNSFTVEATIRPNFYSINGQSYSMIMSNGDHSMAFRVSGGIPYFYIYNGTDWKPLEKALTKSFTSENAKDWHHVAAIYNGSASGGTISVYMDGDIIGSLTGVGQVKPSDFDLGIGVCPETGRTSQNDISTIRLYSQALTEEQLNLDDSAKLALNSVELWYDFRHPEYIAGIGGSVSIQGDAKFEKTLTADISSVIPSGAVLSYNWTRSGEETPISTVSSYTLKAEDIGKTITLTVSGSNGYIGTLTATTAVVEKATQEAPADLTATKENAEDANDGTITGVATAMEYKAAGDEDWSRVVGTTIENLAPGKYLVRYAGTETHFASNSVEVVVLPYVAPPQAAMPEAVFDAHTMLLTDVAKGMQYLVNDGDWTNVAENITVIDLSDAGLTGGSTIQVKQLGDLITTSDSEVQVINLTKAAAPASLGKTDETKAGNDGTITGVDTTMEYKSGDSAWAGATGPKLTDLIPGEYEIRIAGVGTVLASDSVTITIAGYVPTPVTGVVLDRNALFLTVGGGSTSSRLRAAVVPGNADNHAVTWSSSNAAVATVDQNGLVTAVGNGTAVIMVKTEDGNFKAHCDVTVTTYVAPSYDPPTATTKTETKKNENGSTTKTVTDLKTGTVTEATTWPDGTKLVTTISKDGKATSEVTIPSGKDSATVTIPTAQRPGSGQVAVIVKSDGSREIVKTSIATEGGIQVTLTEGVRLEIIDNSKRFVDVNTTDWFDASVQFVASRELMGGTSTETFSPETSTSRAMLMTVLARLDGQDSAAGENWYSVGMKWAKETGISDGTNHEASITREQLAAMLYRYAKANKAKADLSRFSDAGSVSAWAAEAMSWAVESCIIQGANGRLNPTAPATRAEVSAMLERFVKRT